MVTKRNLLDPAYCLSKKWGIHWLPDEVLFARSSVRTFNVHNLKRDRT